MKLNNTKFNIIGTSVRKVDAISKVTGELQYTSDLTLPRMLHCKLLRSPHSHASIVSIDIKTALQKSGVSLILTGQDLPKRFGVVEKPGDETALAIEKVRFIGDPIVAVAATSETAANDAIHYIKVAYAPLKPISNIKEGIRMPEDTPINSSGELGNIHKRISLQFGDVENGFKNADLIREDFFFYEGSTHLAMEEHATIAQYSLDGKLTIWTSTQTPHYLHKAMSKYFDLPASRIRIIAPPNGGGFGGKSEPFNHEFIVAKMAMLTGRPVKIVLTREEIFYLHRGRHPVSMRIKTGVKKNGAITALDFESILDGGAYGSYGVITTHYTGAIQTITYNIPTYKFRGARIFTNKPPCGPKRGHGMVQPRFALEVHLDKIAEQLKINPFDIRRNHLVIPYRKTANHLHVTSINLGRCLDIVEKHSQFKSKYKQLPYGKGIGIAASGFITGASLPIDANKMPHSSVSILIDRGGGVTVFSGSTDIGQGSDTILVMIVAEELGISVDDVRIVSSDTLVTPVDLGSYASRVTLMAGQAAKKAALQLKETLFKTAARLFNESSNNFEVNNGIIYCSNEPHKKIKFVNLVQLAEAEHGTLLAVGSYTPPFRGGKFRGGSLGPSPAYSYSVCVISVDIDLETAALKVEKVWIAHDIGKCINPILVEGQIEGSVYMALGEALMEAQSFRKGLHKTPSMLEYKSPTFLEMPEIEILLVEDSEDGDISELKEAGQGAMLPVAPALANAVYDAVGVRIDETPITQEKIFKAMRQKKASNDGRIGIKRLPKIDYPTPIILDSLWNESF